MPLRPPALGVLRAAAARGRPDRRTLRRRLVAAWYSRPGRHLPKHTHPGKRTMLVSFMLQQLEAARQRDAATPPLDRREYRIWIDRMLADPEVRRENQRIKRPISRWWCDGPLPELDGLTPREAAATPDGRRRVEELLATRENNPFAPGPSLDMRVVRRRLGLAGGKKRTRSGRR